MRIFWLQNSLPKFKRMLYPVLVFRSVFIPQCFYSKNHRHFVIFGAGWRSLFSALARNLRYAKNIGKDMKWVLCLVLCGGSHHQKSIVFLITSNRNMFFCQYFTVYPPRKHCCTQKQICKKFTNILVAQAFFPHVPGVLTHPLRTLYLIRLLYPINYRDCYS